MKTIYLKKLSKALHHLNLKYEYLKKFHNPTQIVVGSLLSRLVSSNSTRLNEMMNEYFDMEYRKSIPRKINRFIKKLVVGKYEDYCKKVFTKLMPNDMIENYRLIVLRLHRSHGKLNLDRMYSFLKENFNKRYLLKHNDTKHFFSWSHFQKMYIYKNNNYFIIQEYGPEDIKFFLFFKDKKFLKEEFIYCKSESYLFFDDVLPSSSIKIDGNRFVSKFNTAILSSLNVLPYNLQAISEINLCSHFNFVIHKPEVESIRLPYHNTIETITDNLLDDYKTYKEFSNSNMLINGHGGTGKTFYLNNIFINKYWKDLTIITIKNKFKEDGYDTSKPRDKDDKSDAIEMTEDDANKLKTNYDVIDHLLELYELYHRPICIIWEEFENIIHNHNREQKMKMLLDRINLENLPIFFIFSTNNYKKLNDSTIYRTGRINYIEEIDNNSYIKINTLEEDYKELLHMYIEMKENVSIDSECFISDYMLLKNVFKKLKRIQSEKKQKELLELVNIKTRGERLEREKSNENL